MKRQTKADWKFRIALLSGPVIALCCMTGFIYMAVQPKKYTNCVLKYKKGQTLFLKDLQSGRYFNYEADANYYVCENGLKKEE